MNIGLDYDGTITNAPDEFKEMARIFRQAGHKVYIVTMRYTSEARELIKTWGPLVDGVVCTGRLAKEPVVKASGIDIHVWIDDNPKAVHMSATEIWGWSSAEGHVIDVKHDAAA